MSKKYCQTLYTYMYSKPGLYAGPNYCQSHMFWWTYGC